MKKISYSKKCLQCHSLFVKGANIGLPDWPKRKFCSRVCKSASQVGGKHSEKHKRKIGNALIYERHWNWRGGKPKCQDCNKVLSRYAAKYCKLCWAKGERNPFWKGGVDSINTRIRKTVQYKDWRKAVFERDNYTCQLCDKVGGNMNADHIKPFAYYPELRFDIDNGRTLCVPCHRSTPTYGKHKALVLLVVS